MPGAVNRTPVREISEGPPARIVLELGDTRKLGRLAKVTLTIEAPGAPALEVKLRR